MWFIIAIIIFLLMLSAFFSGSETGLTAASRAKLSQFKKEGNKRAGVVENLRDDMDRLISTILLGNNAVNILATSLATSLAISLFGSGGVGVVWTTIIMTLLLLIFAELLPKSYAIRYPERVALIVAPIFKYITILLIPLTFLVQFIVNRLMSLMRLNQTPHNWVDGTSALRGAIELHHEEGVVVKDNRDMLDGILDLDETNIEHVMIHRSNIFAIDESNSAEDIISQIITSPYSRIPFWRDKPDNIVGMLHVRDILSKTYKQDKPLSKEDILSLLKEPWFIPDTRSLSYQLAEFRERHNHVALVVDEYGVLLGLVTLEDILEEIVGQIDDEYDHANIELERQSDGSVIINGTMTLRDINRELEWNLPVEDATTIAGLIIECAQTIPVVGQIFQYHGYKFEILEKEQNQITSIRAELLRD